MKNEDFLKSLNDIDDRYFDDAVSEEETKRIRQKNIQAKILRIGSVAAAACLVLVLSALLLLPKLTTAEAKDMFEITALSEGDGGVALETGFKIQFASRTVEYTEDDIKNTIKIVPEIEFTVTKESEDLFILQPEKTLEKNTVYSISAVGQSSFSWAFQTEGDYTVVKTIPYDGFEYAPVSTGIEITFSHLCADVNWEEFFEISPQVEGKFELHNKTVVFVPANKLDYYTKYTVTVKAGLTNDAGQALKENYIFSFKTMPDDSSNPRNFFYLMNEFNETYLPTDPIIIVTNLSNQRNDTPFETSVYKLADQNEYLALAEQNKITKISIEDKDIIDTSGRTPIMQAALQPLKYNDGFVQFVLPEKLAVGYYLVEIRNEEDGTVQKLVQVSDIAVHMQSVNGQTLFWINDSSSGTACENAKIEISAGEFSATASTDKDGLAAIEFNPPEDTLSQIRITSGLKTYAEVQKLAPSEKHPSKDFYFYVYTDREIYQPNDTVNYWGMLLPRRTDAASPSSITLSVPGEENIEVNINADGSFNGKVLLKAKESSYYIIEYYIGEDIIGSHGVDVSEYTKPVYKFTAELDKKYYKRDEAINVALSGAYYDGAAAYGVTVVDNDQASVVLDENGKGMLSYVAQAKPHSSWQPKELNKRFSVGGLDENQFAGELSTEIFPSDIMLETSWVETAADYVQLKISTHAVNFDNVDNGKYFDEQKMNYYEGYYDNIAELLRGETVDLSGTILLKKTVEVKTKEGQYYDYVLKQTVDKYSYSTETVVVEEIPFSTVNGVFVTDRVGYQSSDDEHFYFEINYSSTDGFALSETVYFEEYYRDLQFRYSLQRSDGGSKFSETKPVNLELKNLITGQTPAKGKLLYTVMQDRFVLKSIAASGEVNIPFDEELLPDFTVCGAYFDGKHIYTVESPWFNYDYSERELDVAVSSDKASYRPGEQVTLSLNVKDKTGNGVSANVIVSVVDEAVFAVSEQNADPLGTLYQSLYNVRFSSYKPYFSNFRSSENYNAPHNYAMLFSSFVDYGIFIPGGGQGEDSGPKRCDFADTPAFIPVTTDKDGNAVVIFTLPDNITQWRATVVAVGEEPSGGHTKIGFTATLPFFINAVYDKKLTEADDFSISLRGMGSDLVSSDDIAYKLFLDGAETEINAKAGEYSFAKFGKLTAGIHTIKIEARCKDYSDIIELSVEVVESRLEIPLSETFDLGNGVNINSLKYPVRLTLYDKKYDLYMQGLSYLSRQYGGRGDQQLAQIFARAKQQELNGETFNEPVLKISGVSNVAWAKPDSLLSAKAMISMKKYMQTDSSKQLLLDVVNNYNSSADEVCAAYLGLAALREPVLLDLRTLINSDKIDLNNKLTLATALALLGDFTTAKDWYDNNIAPLIKITKNETTVNNDYEQTANALIINACLKTSDFENMLKYVINNNSSEYLPVLDIMGALVYMQLPDKSESSFSYELNGETLTADFTEKWVHEFLFDEAMLKNAHFKRISGEIGVKACYTGGVDILDMPQNGDMKISKTLDSDNVKVGDRIKITQTIEVEFSQENEFFIINDVLPANTRFDGTERNEEGVLYEENGKLQIIVYNYRYSDTFTPVKKKITVTYYARAILPGEVTVFGSVLMSNVTNGYAACNDLKVTIAP